MKIGDAINELTSTQHRLAVLKCLVEYMETFLPSDTEGAEVFFVEEPCLEPEVPINIVEEILTKINELQVEQVAHLEKLKQLETKDGKPKRTKRSTGRKPAGGRKPAARKS